MQATKYKIKDIGRLKKRSDFLRVGKNDEKWISKILILQKSSNNQNKNNFGITVSKKVSKLAVDRNRIKRKIRSAIYDLLSEMTIKKYDFVIIARNNIINADYNDIKRDLKWCLKRLGCLEK